MRRLARCPNSNCRSHDVSRKRAGDGQGSMDSCAHCGSTWPSVPGTTLASRANKKRKRSPAVGLIFGRAELSDFAPALVIGQGLPKERNGVPCHWYWKQMLRLGRFLDKDGQEQVVTPERVRTIINDTKRAKAAGWEPFLPDGSHSTKESLGYVWDVEQRQDGSLWGLHQFIGDESAIKQKLATNKSSVLTVGPFVDEKGNRYEEFVYHNAILPDPQINDLEDFVPALAASRGAVAVRELNAAPDLKPPTEEPAMPFTDKQIEAIRAKPGMADFAKGVEKDADKVFDAVLSVIDGKENAVKLAASRADAAEAKNLELSRAAPQQAIDPMVAKASVNILHKEVDFLMREGRISAAQAEAAKAEIGTPDKPVLLMLSREGTNHPAEKWLKILGLGESGVKSGEQSKRIELSRPEYPATADGKPDDKKKEGEAVKKHVDTYLEKKYGPPAAAK